MQIYNLVTRITYQYVSLPQSVLLCKRNCCPERNVYPTPPVSPCIRGKNSQALAQLCSIAKQKAKFYNSQKTEKKDLNHIFRSGNSKIHIKSENQQTMTIMFSCGNSKLIRVTACKIWHRKKLLKSKLKNSQKNLKINRA